MTPSRHLSRVAILLPVLALSLVVGSCRTRRPVPLPTTAPWSVTLTPVDVTNPAGTSRTFVATVYDRDRRPLPNVEVRWLLPRGPGSTGEIAAYDDERDESGRPRPVRRTPTGREAVSYTNQGPERLGREAGWLEDDRDWRGLLVGAGQSWCRVEAREPGESQLIAWVPSIADPSRQKAVALAHWGRLPILRASVTGPSRVRVGEEFQVRIQVANPGLAGTRGNVTVDAVFPPGVTVVDGTAFPLDLGALAEKAARSVTVKVRADAEGMMRSTVTAAAGGAITTAELLTEVGSYGIELTNGAGGVYRVGERITFPIRVANPDTDPLREVVFKSPLPTGVTYVDARAEVGRAEFDSSTRTVTWRGFDLAGGAYADLEIVVQAHASGQIESEARVTALAGTVTVHAIQACSVYVNDNGVLHISKVCLTPVIAAGDEAEFEISVWADDGITLENVPVRDELPPGFVPEEDLNWVIDILPPSGGGSWKKRVRARSTASGAFVNRAFTGLFGMPEIAAEAEVEVLPPELILGAEVAAAPAPDPNDPDLVDVGGNASYEITIRNGETFAYDLVVVLALPQAAGGVRGVEFQGASEEGQYDETAHGVRWSRDRLEPGATWKLTTDVRAVSIGSLTAEASLTALGFGGASDQCALFGRGDPEVRVALADGTEADPGAEVFPAGTGFVYVLEVTNPSGAAVRVTPEFEAGGGIELDPGRPVQLATSASPQGVVGSLPLEGGGGEFSVGAFEIPAGERRYVLVPVLGHEPTDPAPAVTTARVGWRLMRDGEPLSLEGSLSVTEQTTIGPP